ncbi:hypothetical protein PsorP6_002724 [Peronosclerospora sorghi]|uniref:Uncharacterized protein n=1 Tax=Peronosclerospora sorghi TaxID=230839 RepID=A0ACC0WT00_9STRA|nr:hypothetical protein PsorP6_002724 [Peronosclerospora sorghi]
MSVLLAPALLARVLRCPRNIETACVDKAGITPRRTFRTPTYIKCVLEHRSVSSPNGAADEGCETLRYSTRTLGGVKHPVMLAWVKPIEADLFALNTEIHARTRSIAQRCTRHQALDVECEQEWRVVQTQRINTTKASLEEHTARITRGKMRTEIFSEQL